MVSVPWQHRWESLQSISVWWKQVLCSLMHFASRHLISNSFLITYDDISVTSLLSETICVEWSIHLSCMSRTRVRLWMKPMNSCKCDSQLYCVWMYMANIGFCSTSLLWRTLSCYCFLKKEINLSTRNLDHLYLARTRDTCSTVKYGLTRVNFLMWIASPKISQFEIKTTQSHPQSINGITHHSKLKQRHATI